MSTSFLKESKAQKQAAVGPEGGAEVKSPQILGSVHGFQKEIKARLPGVFKGMRALANPGKAAERELTFSEQLLRCLLLPHPPKK